MRLILGLLVVGSICAVLGSGLLGAASGIVAMVLAVGFLLSVVVNE